MIKRPLSQHFHQKVLDGTKTSTIRPNPWPVGIPIQLFHWEDKPYRSKHVNGPAVIVRHVKPVQISRDCMGIGIQYRYYQSSLYFVASKDLYAIEGFNSPDDMETWFRRLVKPGQTIQQYQMLFSLFQP